MARGQKGDAEALRQYFGTLNQQQQQQQQQQFYQPSQWISNTTLSTFGTSANQWQFGAYSDPTVDAVKPKTAIEWLRDQVEAITRTAFSEVAAA